LIAALFAIARLFRARRIFGKRKQRQHNDGNSPHDDLLFFSAHILGGEYALLLAAT